jgi:hypothetical protein
VIRKVGKSDPIIQFPNQVATPSKHLVDRSPRHTQARKFSANEQKEQKNPETTKGRSIQSVEASLLSTRQVCLQREEPTRTIMEYT